jgi:hypothetical protein
MLVADLSAINRKSVAESRLTALCGQQRTQDKGVLGHCVNRLATAATVSLPDIKSGNMSLGTSLFLKECAAIVNQPVKN